MINPAISLGGNFQYIWKPSGFSVPAAAVLGAVLAVTF